MEKSAQKVFDGADIVRDVRFTAFTRQCPNSFLPKAGDATRHLPFGRELKLKPSAPPYANLQ